MESFRRYLLQVAAVDRLVGALIEKLERIGTYDETLLIVAADHGVSFKPGSRRRDSPPESNLDEDILPTIVDALQITTTWQLDGRSVVGDDVEPRPKKTAYYHYGDFERHEAPADLEGWRVPLAWKLSHFEARRGVVGLFRSGPYQALHDRPTASLPIGPRAPGHYQLTDEALYLQVDPSGGLVPALLRASLTLPEPAGQPQPIAVALNGRIEALSTVQLDDTGDGRLTC